MSFISFLLYDLICFIIKVFCCFILFYVFKDKLADLLLNRQLDKTFDNLMNKSILDINIDDDSNDDFVDSINVIDDDSTSDSTYVSNDDRRFF